MSFSDQDLANRDYTVKIGQYFGRGWEIFKQYAWPFIGFMLLVGVIGAIASRLPYPLGVNEDKQGGIVNALLSPAFGAGFYIVAFKIAKGRTPSFSDFFQGFSRYLPIFLVSLVSSLLIGLGMVLLIIPGLYLAVAYLFALPLVLDKRLDFWPAMETSRKLITKQWFGFFGLILLVALLNVAGALALGIGLFVTAPWSTCTIAAAYEDIVGLNGSSAEIEV